MTNKNKQYSFIFEQTTVVSPSDIQILEETKLPDGRPKISFLTRLQEADVKNNNRRIYTNPICESIVNKLSPRAQGGSFLMEVDHPMFFSGSSDPNQMKKRATIVEISNCGAKCNNIYLKNGQVMGEVSTLSGFEKDPINIKY